MLVHHQVTGLIATVIQMIVCLQGKYFKQITVAGSNNPIEYESCTKRYSMTLRVILTDQDYKQP